MNLPFRLSVPYLLYRFLLRMTENSSVVRALLNLPRNLGNQWKFDAMVVLLEQHLRILLRTLKFVLFDRLFNLPKEFHLIRLIRHGLYGRKAVICYFGDRLSFQTLNFLSRPFVFISLILLSIKSNGGTGLNMVFSNIGLSFDCIARSKHFVLPVYLRNAFQQKRVEVKYVKSLVVTFHLAQEIAVEILLGTIDKILYIPVPYLLLLRLQTQRPGKFSLQIETNRIDLTHPFTQIVENSPRPLSQQSDVYNWVKFVDIIVDITRNVPELQRLAIVAHERLDRLVKETGREIFVSFQLAKLFEDGVVLLYYFNHRRNRLSYNKGTSAAESYERLDCDYISFIAIVSARNLYNSRPSNFRSHCSASLSFLAYQLPDCAWQPYRRCRSPILSKIICLSLLILKLQPSKQSRMKSINITHVDKFFSFNLQLINQIIDCIDLLQMQKQSQRPDNKVAQLADKLKTVNKKSELQDELLSINISPKDYHGMKYFGNYPHQRDNRSHADIRLPHLAPQYFLNKHVLDLGCGDGALGIQIAIKMFPAKIVLLDIDARQLHQAHRSVDHFTKMNSKYQALKQDELMLKKIEQLPHFFKQQLQKDTNRYEIKMDNVQVVPHGLDILCQFPNNVFFLNNNFFTIDMSVKYDTVLCMGVTKWLHLSFGDRGITTLFEKISDILKQNGYLILEYSLLTSYKDKKNLHKLFRKNYDESILVKPQKFSQVLECLGLTLVKEAVSSPTNPLRRPLAIFRKAAAAKKTQ